MKLANNKENSCRLQCHIEDWNDCITISAIYLLPKHIIKKEQYITFFETLDNHFIAADDYNAEHTHRD